MLLEGVCCSLPQRRTSGQFTKSPRAVAMRRGFTSLPLQLQCTATLCSYSVLRNIIHATHYSLPTTHYPLLTAHYPLLITHYSPLTTHYSLLTNSLLTNSLTHYPLSTTRWQGPVADAARIFGVQGGAAWRGQGGAAGTAGGWQGGTGWDAQGGLGLGAQRDVVGRVAGGASSCRASPNTPGEGAATGVAPVVCGSTAGTGAWYGDVAAGTGVAIGAQSGGAAAAWCGQVGPARGATDERAAGVRASPLAPPHSPPARLLMPSTGGLSTSGHSPSQVLGSPWLSPLAPPPPFGIFEEAAGGDERSMTLDGAQRQQWEQHLPQQQQHYHGQQ